MDIDEDHRPRYMVFSKVSLVDSKSTTLKKIKLTAAKNAMASSVCHYCWTITDLFDAMMRAKQKNGNRSIGCQ